VFWGAGSAARVPKAPFTFVTEDTSGTKPKIDITDAAGVKWSVKLPGDDPAGNEVHAEIAATRLVWALGYYWSTAVAVGFLALYGVAVQTGVVMVIYLHEALDKKLAKGTVTEKDIYDATFEGAVLRLRPKLMTVSIALIGLIPIMWATGTGADVMKPIAAPMIGGMISSAVHVLIMTPVIFVMMKKRELKKGRLTYSGMGH